MRAAIQSGFASWSVLSPGEVAERHRKKVSSQARVREHTARVFLRTPWSFVLLQISKAHHYKLLTFWVWSKAFVSRASPKF